MISNKIWQLFLGKHNINFVEIGCRKKIKEKDKRQNFPGNGEKV